MEKERSDLVAFQKVSGFVGVERSDEAVFRRGNVFEGVEGFSRGTSWGTSRDLLKEI